MVYCVILASGTGTRMGKSNLPKQFHYIQGKPLIYYTLKTVVKSDLFDYIYLGIAKEYVKLCQKILEDFFPIEERKNIKIVEGASERMDTFGNAYYQIKANTQGFTQEDYICLTDANRPLTSVEIYRMCLEKAKQYGACCPAHPVIDGVCIVKKDSICSIPEKKDLYSFQTPECFRILDYERISEGAEKGSYNGICELFNRYGLNPHIVPSSDRCFKITYPVDWDLLDSYLHRYSD